LGVESPFRLDLITTDELRPAGTFSNPSNSDPGSSVVRREACLARHAFTCITDLLGHANQPGAPESEGVHIRQHAAAPLCFVFGGVEETTPPSQAAMEFLHHRLSMCSHDHTVQPSKPPLRFAVPVAEEQRQRLKIGTSGAGHVKILQTALDQSRSSAVGWPQGLRGVRSLLAIVNIRPFTARQLWTELAFKKNLGTASQTDTIAQSISAHENARAKFSERSLPAVCDVRQAETTTEEAQ